MKTILFISTEQYGYNTDMLKYSEYLNDEYKMTFLTVDTGLKKVSINSAEVIYTKKQKIGLLTRLSLAVKSIMLIYKSNPVYIFVKYFAGCSIIYLFCHRKKMIVDIRTATISNDARIRNFKDKVLSFEANIFKNISVISEGVLKKLKLNRKKTFVLPLGADRFVANPCQSESRVMHLLYVGTLDYRNIHDTIKGFGAFYNKHRNEVVCKYTIIGFADNKEYEEEVIKTIMDYGLSQIVYYVGRKRYDELSQFFETHNIGVSYVPITEYFQYQPPTKTYEYIQNGLVCIATNTVENQKVINESNGVLINEGAQAFCEGLEHIYQNLNAYNSKEISDSAAKYSWENIVNTIFKQHIAKI